MAAEGIANVETLLDSVWRPRLVSIGNFGFVCSNTATTEGESVELESDDRHLVCCTSCASLIADQCEQFRENSSTQSWYIPHTRTETQYLTKLIRREQTVASVSRSSLLSTSRRGRSSPRPTRMTKT
ncbi:hypothetical protein [Halococcus qingdaonensis]|uniref:hypothetical protein n=1 Tax=Halococcus qingdaonensis TaxID=224402 RepID=UPI003F85085C